MNEWEIWNNEQIRQNKGLKLNNIFNKPQEKPWYKDTKWGGQQIKIINRLMSGHDYTKKHLKIWRIETTDICEECNAIEDINHVILKCKKYNKQRNEKSFTKNNYSNILDIFKNKDTKSINEIVELILKNNIKM